MELIRRRQARTGLAAFTAFTKPDFSPGWFHREVCAELDRFLARVLLRQSPRLIIVAPPRHGKSELATRRLSAFALGQDPRLKIIGASYGMSLAQDMNRDVQAIIDDADGRYQALFPRTQINSRNVRTDEKRGSLRNADEFETIGFRGGYLAAGVGVGITGKGADIFIVDDPVRGHKDASSPTVREDTWRWYLSDARSRVSPGGGIIVMATRWHKDDLIGRLLEREPGRWRLCHYRAVALEDEPHRRAGEALDPNRWPLEALAEFQTNSYEWSALYQGQPFIRGGGTFRREWLRAIPDYPRGAPGVRYWDLASALPMPGTDPDWTVGARVHYEDGRWFLVDVARMRGSPHEVNEFIRATAEADGRTFPQHIEEMGGGGKFAISSIRRACPGLTIYGHHKGPVPKVEMARPWASAAEGGNFFIVHGAPWRWDVAALLNEIEEFPNASHDDQIDAISGAVAVLSRDVVPTGSGGVSEARYGAAY